MSQTTDRLDPHPERVASIRRWHADQAISERQPVALIAMTLADDNTITTSLVGMEPEFARSMLEALYSLTSSIEAHANEYRPELELVRNDGPMPTNTQAKRRRAKVVPLRLV